MDGPQPPAEDMPSHEDAGTVTELRPDMRGCYLVHAKTSEHLWDLDHFIYMRLPGPHATPMDYDGVEVPIRHVAHWPKVGGQSLVYYDSPKDPLWEEFRLCSTITSIERLQAPEAGMPSFRVSDRPEPDEPRAQ